MINSTIKSILEGKPVSDFVGRCVANYLTKISDDNTAVDVFPPEYVKELLTESEEKALEFTLFNARHFGFVPDSVIEILNLMLKTGITSKGEQIIGIYPCDTILSTESTNQLIIIAMPKSISRASKYGVIFHDGKDNKAAGITVVEYIQHTDQEEFKTILQWEYDVKKGVNDSYDLIPIGYESKITFNSNLMSAAIEYNGNRVIETYNVADILADGYLRNKYSASIICESFQLVENKDVREELERIFSLINDVFAHAIYKEFVIFFSAHGLSKSHYELNVATFVDGAQTPSSLVLCVDNEIREVEFDADDGHWVMDINGDWSYESDDKNITLLGNDEIVKIEDVEIIDSNLEKSMKKSGSKIRKLTKKAKRYMKAYFG